MRNLKAKLSVVIQPPKEIIDEVARLKQNLAAQIGTFQSLESEAHITLNTFEGAESVISIWEIYLNSFAAQQTKLNLRFNRVQAFSNGALVILGDDKTDLFLKNLIQDLYKNRPKGFIKKSQRAHLTLARKLTKEQMNVAVDLLNDVDYSFDCDALVFRKLNWESKCYIELSRFPFLKNQ